jgi:hypothetical protein
MAERLITFTLRKPNVFFSEKQKQDIQFHVDYEENWRHFSSLKTITFKSINDTSFVVRVDDEGDSWHSGFARKLKLNASLENLCLEPPTSPRLFLVKE